MNSANSLKTIWPQPSISQSKRISNQSTKLRLTRRLGEMPSGFVVLSSGTLPMTIVPPRIGPQPWEVVRTKLDQSLPFANMRDTPYYRDAVWEQFSKAEYECRYRRLREKMREHKLDVVIVPGGPRHWSFGGGMLRLTGHWEWHALSSYVLVPLEGEPSLIYSMGGTHTEAVGRQVDVAF